MIIKKKRNAQSCLRGKFVATSGYAKNAKPTPGFTISEMSFSATTDLKIKWIFAKFKYNLHVAQDWENGKAGQNTRAAVDKAHNDGVTKFETIEINWNWKLPITVVIKLVVRAQSNQSAKTYAIRIENLNFIVELSGF